jgi:hypothetical protein
MLFKPRAARLSVQAGVNAACSAPTSKLMSPFCNDRYDTSLNSAQLTRGVLPPSLVHAVA